MTTEDKQTVFSVVLAAVLSVVIVGIGLLSALALTDRPRPTLEDTLSIRPKPTPANQPQSINASPPPAM